MIFGDIALYTGWTFQQIGELTLPQIRTITAAVRRRREEQIKMMGGTVSGDSGSGKEVDITESIEQKLQFLRNKTGKKTFDLREVL